MSIFLSNRSTLQVAVASLLLCCSGAAGMPHYFADRCTVCHYDDSATCDGCHHHRGALSARTDKSTYAPGEAVRVTIDGGAQGSGWIRALLQDSDLQPLDIQSGPTRSGDDGLGDPIELPLVLHGVAPAEQGEHTWYAAWLGGASSGGGEHRQADLPVVVRVENPVGIDGAGDPTWSALKAQRQP